MPRGYPTMVSNTDKLMVNVSSYHVGKSVGKAL
jgi:hypothetical protein